MRGVSWSISFLDLITCGLGAVTLLFLVLLAVKGRVDFGIETPEASPDEQRLSPFVIVVVATTGEPLLAGGENDGWRIDGPLDLDTLLGLGPLHASLYARRLPAPETRILLGGLRKGTSPRVQVLSGGRRLRTFTLQVTGDAEPIQIWPLPLLDGDAEGRP